MPTFITVATFNFPSDMHSARALLETEGIECFVRDELTAQVHNFYSQAIGGVKLQVKEADAERAKRLLIQAGYIKEEKHELSGFWKGVDKMTRTIPWIKKFGLEVRFLIVIAIVLLIIPFSYPIYAILTAEEKPYVPTKEYLLNTNLGRWCVSKVTFEDKHYKPFTTSNMPAFIQVYGSCEEELRFLEDGTIALPGFESDLAIGQWTFENEKLHISNIDTFHYVYEGNFEVTRGDHKMQLKSEKTTIHCYIAY
ncbi:putative signal transducing protein [Halocola ammonii]